MRAVVARKPLLSPERAKNEAVFSALPSGTPVPGRLSRSWRRVAGARKRRECRSKYSKPTPMSKSTTPEGRKDGGPREHAKTPRVHKKPYA